MQSLGFHADGLTLVSDMHDLSFPFQRRLAVDIKQTLVQCLPHVQAIVWSLLLP